MSDQSGHSAAAVAEPHRDQREAFRCSADERAAIAALAAVHGLKPGTYCRLAALGRLDAPVEPQRGVSRLPPPSVNAGIDESGAIVKIDQGKSARAMVVRGAGVVDEMHSGTAEDFKVAAEVAEAKLQDDPARDAYVKRRTRELYGQGKTTRNAESQAEEEWENRGL